MFIFGMNLPIVEITVLLGVITSVIMLKLVRGDDGRISIKKAPESEEESDESDEISQEQIDSLLDQKGIVHEKHVQRQTIRTNAPIKNQHEGLFERDTEGEESFSKKEVKGHLPGSDPENDEELKRLLEE